MDGRHGVYGGRETEETTGEDWRLRGRARAGHPYRRAVWLNALHREAVSFNGLYVSYALVLSLDSDRVILANGAVPLR